MKRLKPPENLDSQEVLPQTGVGQRAIHSLAIAFTDLGVKLNSNLPGVLESGLLPFQQEGIEFMLTQDRCIYFYWSSGSGKALAAEATILCKARAWRELDDGGFDVCFYVVKPSNLTGALRKLERHTGLQGRILGGDKQRRSRTAEEIASEIDSHQQPILIFNGEKFREDREELKLLVEDSRLLVIWDEMPSKFSNRETATYRAAAEVLYTSFAISNRGKSRGKKVYYPKAGKERAADLFSVALSATPIYNSPGDTFNWIRLMHPELAGTVKSFNSTHIAYRDPWGKPAKWQNLELWRDKIKPIVHTADKRKDERIRTQFPEELPSEIVDLDLDLASQKIYDILASHYEDIANSSVLGYHEILSAINCLQLVCCNPRSVFLSAAKHSWYLDDRANFISANQPSTKELTKWDRQHKIGSEVALKLVELVNNDKLFTDRDKSGCTVSKLLRLQSDLEEHDGKAIVFTSLNEMVIPFIAEWLEEWDISYVTFHGKLNPKQRTETIDLFQEDPDIKVFLSNDAGSDSIDLPAASLTIHYDLAYTDAAMSQRRDRQSRIDSEMPFVQEKIYVTPFTVEDRKLEILAEKRSYTDVVFGEAEADEQVLSSTDLLYILTGQGKESS